MLQDVKSYSNRQPRKQSSGNSKISFLLPKPTSDELEVDPSEEEDLLSLSPQPSIISTVTHGATNSLHKSRSKERVKESYTHAPVSSTQRTITRISAAPKVFNFGDVLFGSRSKDSSVFGSRSSSKETGFGSRSSSVEQSQSSSSSNGSSCNHCGR